MRSLLSISALAILALAPAPAVLAQSAGSTSVGVIDFQRAVVDTAEFEKAYNTITAKYQPMQTQIQRMQEELADIETQLRAASGQLSTSGEAELQERGLRKQRDLERLTQDLQEGFELDRDQALTLVSTRMQEVLNKLAVERSLDVIVDRTAAPFVREGLDITDAAITAYNTAYPAN